MTEASVYPVQSWVWGYWETWLRVSRAMSCCPGAVVTLSGDGHENCLVMAMGSAQCWPSQPWLVSSRDSLLVR